MKKIQYLPTMTHLTPSNRDKLLITIDELVTIPPNQKNFDIIFEQRMDRDKERLDELLSKRSDKINRVIQNAIKLEEKQAAKMVKKEKSKKKDKSKSKSKGKSKSLTKKRVEISSTEKKFD